MNPDGVVFTPEHHKSLKTLVILVAIVVVVGLVYWLIWSFRSQTVPPMDPDMQSRAEMSAVLMDMPSRSTPEEINRVINVMSKTPSTVTSQDRERMASILENL